MGKVGQNDKQWAFKYLVIDLRIKYSDKEDAE